ncbi:uncharacterized protein LOC131432949 [Malaya genurostris]|uniref:uncharacterized protein LOC131432949 n=1 Tax=Malaya genurostris TaxID=325434 RepID=UPI0026F3A370|nr:uncharacterized protein LOC131432949 [Malaya genurostris]
MSSTVMCVICETVLKYNREDTGNLIQHLRDNHRHGRSMKSTRSKHVENPPVESSDEIILEMESLPVMVESEGHFSHDHQSCTVKDVIEKAIRSTESAVSDNIESISSDSDEFEISSSASTSRDNLQEKLIRETSNYGRRKVMYERRYRPRRPIRTCRRVLYRTTVENWRPGGLRITCPVCGKSRIPVIRCRRERETNSSIWASFLSCCWPFCCLPCCFPKPKREFLHCSACEAYLAKYDYEADCIQPNFKLFEGG